MLSSGCLVAVRDDAAGLVTMSRKHKAFSVKEKCKLGVEESPKRKRVDLAREFGLPVSTLSTIVSQQEELRKKLKIFGGGVKQMRGANHQLLEDVLLTWFEEVGPAGVNVDIQTSQLHTLLGH